MARLSDEWSGTTTKRFRILSSPGVLSVAELAIEMQCSRRVIKAKLAEMNLTAPDIEDGGKERRCINWNSWERPCKNTFVSKYAGPCPRCQGQASATRFELPASLL